MKATVDQFLNEYSASIRDGDASIFIGAGVSMAAGYPSWIGLLKEIGDEVGVSSKDVHDLAALAQWSLNANRGDRRVKDVINREISPIRETPPVAEVIARLPVRNIWTTNYDDVIERAFAQIGRPIQSISEAANLGRKPIQGAARLFKMHGTITNLDTIVISTDDYELYDKNRGAFLPVLQSHLTTSSMLFVGVSFVDPNLRHILSVIRSRFEGSGREHFAIVRPPQREDYDSSEEFAAKLRHHEHWSDDLHRYGLKVVEIDEYDEIDGILRKLEHKVSADKVWISGSWVEEHPERPEIVDLAHRLGWRTASQNYSLVSGYGLVVGSASVSGFLAGSRDSGRWDTATKLIARPFPQPDQTGRDHRQQWTALRNEMARLAGHMVVIGGVKISHHNSEDNVVIADGVLEEVELSRALGKQIIPVGASGGAAEVVAKSLLGTIEFGENGNRLRPTDEELRFLSDREKDNAELVSKIFEIIDGVQDG